MSSLRYLNPSQLWIFFEEICNIPRISKNEEKIGQYLLDFAKKHNLDSKKDEIGNVLIIRKADQGFENKKSVVLQSHLDMVGEKNSDHPHNWATDPIEPYAADGWVAAKGTTLGADDGIGIAAQMAILVDKNFKAGRIECLFTVDEETGMSGAINLKPDFFSGRTLLNLDSEDEGILFIGCAGGMDTVGTMNYKLIPVVPENCSVEISVTGLHGGHSGDEIHKGYGNSLKIIVHLLHEISKKHEIAISSFAGGNLRNAIPREAFTTITVNRKEYENVKIIVSDLFNELRDLTGSREPNLNITAKEVSLPSHTIDKESQVKFLELLDKCPHGVIAWSKDMEDLVETSTNLASAKINQDRTITIVTTQRSSVEISKNEIAAKVRLCMTEAGARVVHSDGYPGWKPDISSEILGITCRSYINLFGKKPVVRAIHAGLECGMFYEKFEGIDMISLGPTIRGAHTPEEKIEIQTVEMFWNLLTDVILNIPEK
jgi:dipeptidase D